MQSQKALVEVVGRFTPKIVKMDGAKHKIWKKKKKTENQQQKKSFTAKQKPKQPSPTP